MEEAEHYRLEPGKVINREPGETVVGIDPPRVQLTSEQAIEIARRMICEWPQGVPYTQEAWDRVFEQWIARDRKFLLAEEVIELLSRPNDGNDGVSGVPL